MKAVKDNETEAIEENQEVQEQGIKEAGVHVGKDGNFVVLELRVPPPAASLGFKMTIEQALAVAKVLEITADQLAEKLEQETESEPIEVV